MRGYRLLWIPAVVAGLAAGGCGPARHDAGADASAAPQASPRALAPAPAQPDLAVVMERFYQQVEGRHWVFAYAMLSPRYRATLSRPELMQRYDSLNFPQVKLRQTNGTSVVARLDGTDRNDSSRALHVEETVTLAWDGEQWTIDDIARRDVTPSTR